MKILYGIQGTGNGHIARAEDIVPELQKYGSVDLLVSGAQSDITLPYPVKYTSKGLSFYFGKKGGVDLVRTFSRNSSKAVWKEIKGFPIENYDLVVNDFEPISAWASRLRGIPSVALSHQSALLSTNVPKPDHLDPVGRYILKHYAPASRHVGFHFKAFDKNIFTPVIRRRVREARCECNRHFTVYLPAFEEKKLLPVLCAIPEVEWHVFSKHSRIRYRVGNISVFPVSNELFTQSMASAAGVLCGAGFETPAEALYLGKKLIVIPMKKQYEQYYNAAALRQMGVPVLLKLRQLESAEIREYIFGQNPTAVEYDDPIPSAVKQAVVGSNC